MRLTDDDSYQHSAGSRTGFKLKHQRSLGIIPKNIGGPEFGTMIIFFSSPVEYPNSPVGCSHVFKARS